MHVPPQEWETELQAIRDQGLWRQIRTPSMRQGPELVHEGKRLLNLSSNDYLGLAADEDLGREFMRSLADWPGGPLWGSTASRLMTGSFAIQEDLEAKLAGLYPGRQAVLFNSGYHANLGLVPALVGPGDVIFCDRLIHASLIDGIRLSGARLFRYRHADANHLATLLTQHRGGFRRALIITESVFSMDGDLSDLAPLVELKRQHGALLVVDEAHAFGVTGPQGAGLAAAQGLGGEVDVVIGTFGKALASMGAFVAAPPPLTQLLIQKARPLIFSTALPPVCTAWVCHLLDHPDRLEQRRAALARLSRDFRDLLPPAWNIPAGQWIIPVICGSAPAALEAAREVQAVGFYALPIRPPTVPANTARLRISLRADLSLSALQPLALRLARLTEQGQACG